MTEGIILGPNGNNIGVTPARLKSVHFQLTNFLWSGIQGWIDAQLSECAAETHKRNRATVHFYKGYYGWSLPGWKGGMPKDDIDTIKFQMLFMEDKFGLTFPVPITGRRIDREDGS